MINITLNQQRLLADQEQLLLLLKETYTMGESSSMTQKEIVEWLKKLILDKKY
jgi:hypothetical protein